MKQILNTNYAMRNIFYLILFAVSSLLSCHRLIVTNNSYKGISNNSKIITEGLKLKTDKSFKYSYTIFDTGQYALNIEYLGSYNINKEIINFSLDTIKTFTSRVYIPGEKRTGNPFENHKISIVSSAEKEQFRSGELRLKSEYSINKSKNLIMDGLQKKFVKLD